MALSSMGIIALILAGYTFLALSFILVFAVPSAALGGLWLYSFRRTLTTRLSARGNRSALSLHADCGEIADRSAIER